MDKSEFEEAENIIKCYIFNQLSKTIKEKSLQFNINKLFEFLSEVYSKKSIHKYGTSEFWTTHLYEEYVLTCQSISQNISKDNLIDGKPNEFLTIFVRSPTEWNESLEWLNDVFKHNIHLFQREEFKEEIAKIREYYDKKHIQVKDLMTVSGMFTCRHCKSKRTVHYQLQTRSADEPMTTFIECLDCGFKWKE